MAPLRVRPSPWKKGVIAGGGEMGSTEERRVENPMYILKIFQS